MGEIIQYEARLFLSPILEITYLQMDRRKVKTGLTEKVTFKQRFKRSNGGKSQK